MTCMSVDAGTGGRLYRHTRKRGHCSVEDAGEGSESLRKETPPQHGRIHVRGGTGPGYDFTGYRRGGRLGRRAAVYSALPPKRYPHRTAYDLSRAPEEWVKEHLKIPGVRMVRELLGEPCYDLETEPEAKKGICPSRSFSTALTDRGDVSEAVSSFAARVGEKLRR